MEASLLSFIKTAFVGYVGGQLFYLIDLPLPWIIGSLTFIIIRNAITRKEVDWPAPLKDGGIIILGISFGLYFTMDTFLHIGPYFIPFLVVNLVLIFLSIVISMVITKWISIDKITSVFGSIPGGLPEMVLASESLHAKSAYVLIFQTIRLLTVLFIVPSVIIYWFKEQNVTADIVLTNTDTFGGWGYLLFLIPIMLAFLFHKKIPAGLLIVPLMITAIMNMSPIDMPRIPDIVLFAGQVAVGIGLGQGISYSTLKTGGKYCVVYFGVTVLLIMISFGLGGLLALFTNLDLETAILCVAPGGFIEMVLTAGIVGADPSIVSALQLTRILVIIIFVLPILKWYFKKTEPYTTINDSHQISK